VGDTRAAAAAADGVLVWQVCTSQELGPEEVAALKGQQAGGYTLSAVQTILLRTFCLSVKTAEPAEQACGQ